MEKHHYNVDIEWCQDRKGTMCSPELAAVDTHCVEVTTPPEFPNGIPNIWPSEHFHSI